MEHRRWGYISCTQGGPWQHWLAIENKVVVKMRNGRFDFELIRLSVMMTNGDVPETRRLLTKAIERIAEV